MSMGTKRNSNPLPNTVSARTRAKAIPKRVRQNRSNHFGKPGTAAVSPVRSRTALSVRAVGMIGVMRVATVVWAMGLVPVLGACGSDAQPHDEVVPVTTTMAKPVTTAIVSTTAPPTSTSDGTRRFCTTDARRGRNGELYGRDPNQGCKFVDDRGQVLPDQ